MAYRALSKGDRISEYVLAEKVGQGGFGEVWRAEHVQIPGKLVAIKVPTSPEAMDLLRKEAVFQHQLDHPNIVRTVGLDVEHDTPNIYNDNVEGPNHRQFMTTEGILPPPYAIDIAAQVLEALAYAHGRGILHKDIKPENILVEKRRVQVAKDAKALVHYVKITDLGLGQPPTKEPGEMVRSANSRTSGLRQLAGTLFYMAPESMLPEPASSVQSDLYSVGVVLYEMLTGELPLGMDLPSELNPVVTPELDRVCKTALSIDLQQRYATARDMIADLQKAKEAFLLRLVASGAPAGQVVSGEVRAVRAEVAAAPPVHRAPMAARLFEWAVLGFVLALVGLSAHVWWKGHAEQAGATAEPAPAPVREAEAVVKLETVPPDAELFLDNRPLERGAEYRLPYGSHELRVSRDFHEARLFHLEPRLVDGRRHLALVDVRTRAQAALADVEGRPGDLGRLELVRQKGSLRLETPNAPQALVELDGQSVGVTPLELKDLDAGPHAIKLSHARFKALEFGVTVRPGEPVLREMLLMPVEGPEASDQFHSVPVTSRPAGASVYVNEVEKGVTPLTLQLPDGAYRLRLELRYHETFEDVLKVAGAQSITVPMTRVHGWISLDSEPRGARVSLDGRELGEIGSGPLLQKIEGGRHEAEFVLPGHYPTKVAFEVLSKDQTVPVKAALLKVPPAKLFVDCEVPGAEVWIDDQVSRAGPGGAFLVSPGKHRVRVLGIEKEADLEPGAERKLRFDLRALKLVYVPAGRFLHGVPEKHWLPRQTKQQEELLPGFYCDEGEVTNEQYAVFLDWMKRTNDHSKCDPNEGRNKNHTPHYWSHPDFRDAARPVVGVDYFDACAYAAWAGKRLPSEKEWEKAARGTDGRTYPWGDDWSANEKRLNWGDANGDSDGFRYTAPAGSFPDGRSPFGCLDMAGNVWEWTKDLSDDRGTHRVVKGGSYLVKTLCRSWERDFQAPNQALLKDLGFRCVLDGK